MDVQVGRWSTLARLAAGESLHDCINEMFEASDRRHATIASCIGSVRYVDYGFAQVCEGIPGPGARRQCSEALEVLGISGGIGIDREGQLSAHLHGALVGPAGEFHGGHIFEAVVLITMEVTLIGDGAVRWERYHAPVEGSGPLPLLRPRPVIGS